MRVIGAGRNEIKGEASSCSELELVASLNLLLSYSSENGT